MAQEQKNTQSVVVDNTKQTKKSASNQPPIVKPFKNLDPEPEIKAETVDTVEVEREQNPNDELLTLLKEQKGQIEDLKKGLYDQGKRWSAKVDAVKPSKPSEATSESDELTDEAKAKETLHNMGFISRDVLMDELTKFEKVQEDVRSLDEICVSNQSINKELLKSLGKAEPEMAWEDIIEKYNLNGGDKIKKSHDRQIKGMPITKEHEKPVKISDMNNDEFKNFIKQNSRGDVYSKYI